MQNSSKKWFFVVASIGGVNSWFSKKIFFWKMISRFFEKWFRDFSSIAFPAGSVDGGGYRAGFFFFRFSLGKRGESYSSASLPPPSPPWKKREFGTKSSTPNFPKSENQNLTHPGWTDFDGAWIFERFETRTSKNSVSIFLFAAVQTLQKAGQWFTRVFPKVASRSFQFKI